MSPRQGVPLSEVEEKMLYFSDSGWTLPGARVLAVADIVESMASARPYRPSLGLEAASIEIEEQAGTLLDPEAVRICFSLFREKGFALPV